MPKSQLPTDFLTDEPVERRRAARHVACFPTHLVFLSEDAPHLCVSHDLSRSGGLFLTQARLREGQPVHVELYLSDDITQRKLVEARAVRVFRREARGTFWPYAAALRFDTTIDEAEPGLEACCARQRGQRR